MISPQNLIRVLTLALVILALTGTSVYSQTGDVGKKQKIAQTGYQFLSVGSDARAGALGEAVTTIPVGSSSLFFNPAGMAHMNGRIDLVVSQNNWIADITHNAFALAFNPWSGRFGTFGISLMNINYGEFLGTMVWPNDQGFMDTGVFSPIALAVGAGYARKLSDRFSVGGHVKYATQYLGAAVVPTGDDSLTVQKAISDAIAYDFGTIYRTGFKDLLFGMSVRNFSNEIKYVSESFQLPLTFRIGVSMNVFNFLRNSPSGQSLRLSIDAAHPRSHPEYVNFGLEYSLLEMFVIRGGYILNVDEQNYTFGFGINLSTFTFDYAYTPFGVFDNVQRFSFRFLF